MKRYALIGSKSTRWDDERVIARYLPDNYRVLASGLAGDDLDLPASMTGVVIGGVDRAGWTLDGYVLPRLASGLIHGREIDLSHPAMRQVPVKAVQG